MVIAVRKGVVTFKTISRAVGTSPAEFSHSRDACHIGRNSHPAKSIWYQRLAPRTELHETSDGYRLSWPGGEARFVHDYDAINFRWIATPELAEIGASYTHPNGEPRVRPERSSPAACPMTCRAYSHSMVPGGLLVTSSTTRLTSRTSLVIRVEMRSSRS